MENKRFLIDRDSFFAIPFWYNRERKGLVFKRYEDEESIPKRYKDKTINVEKRMYKKPCYTGFVFLEQDIIVHFPEDWSPYLVYPQQAELRNFKSPLVPPLKFSITYYDDNAINHPPKYLKEEICSTKGKCTITGFYIDDDDFYDEEYEDEIEDVDYGYEKITLKESVDSEGLNYLEFSIYFLTILSMMNGKTPLLEYETMIKLMLEPYAHLFVNVNYMTDELLQALGKCYLYVPFFPKKYKKQINDELQKLLNDVSSRVYEIEIFLSTYK